MKKTKKKLIKKYGEKQSIALNELDKTPQF